MERRKSFGDVDPGKGVMRSQNSSNLQLQQKIIATIRNVVPECLAIYRFGSWGTVDQRADSDIDLAILPTDMLDPLVRWDLAQQLAAIAGQDVDLVDLHNASTVLQMQVVSSGERLYCAANAEVERFEDKVFSSYARFNSERRSILEDVKKRGSVYGK